MKKYDEPSYFEEITINIQTTSGIYEFILSVQVQNKQAVTSTDLFVTLAICAPIIVVLFIAILAIIYGKTKVTIELYLKKNEPLELDLTFFKKRAIKDLAQQYLVEENWQVGLLLAETYDQDYSKQYNKIKARDLIITGQNKLNKGLLQDGLDFWLKARKSLEVIGNHELLDTMDFQLQPLERIVEAVFAKKADEKAASLQKEFNNLSSMKTQRKSILGITIDIPLYLVAVQAGLAYKMTNELETSLNYLQIAYQDAPEDKKNGIVTQITSLIALGVKPSEMAFPVDQAAIQERIAKRETRCFSCGEVMKSSQEKCPNCEMEPVLCSVCKLPVS
ncbi:MAG: hypothetical protein ACTSP5_14660, partial [Candidatus Heimdallarchaeota archaeon]